MSSAPSYDPAVAATHEPAAREVPAPTLSVFDATMITVGIVIGAGIFETPVLVASIAGSPGPMILAWVLGGASARPVGINYAAYVWFGSVRTAVMGASNRPPDQAELRRMRAMVADAMCRGAMARASAR